MEVPESMTQEQTEGLVSGSLSTARSHMVHMIGTTAQQGDITSAQKHQGHLRVLEAVSVVEPDIVEQERAADAIETLKSSYCMLMMGHLKMVRF